MGRELQKKKNRSSLHKVRQKPKSKKRLVLNPLIAANWDKRQTLAQNYRRMGLSSQLNTPSGGTEKSHSAVVHDAIVDSLVEEKDDSLAIAGTSLTSAAAEIRVDRDPKTGKIIRLLEQPEFAYPSEVVAENSDVSDAEWQGFEDVHAPLGHLGSRAAKSGVVRQLELQAKQGVRKAPRKQSTREEEWIERLIERHGTDYSAMFRDHKLNPMQQTQGELRRRVTKYRKARE